MAYKHIIIKPEVVGDLTDVKGSYDSPYGLISSEWKKTGKRFELIVQVPANTTAAVFVPADEGSTILMDGKTVRDKKGRSKLTIGNEKYQLNLESGKYIIVVENKIGGDALSK